MRFPTRLRSLLLATYIILPIMSVSGAIIVSTYGNNLLLLMVVIIALVVVVNLLFDDSYLVKYYPLAILSIAISLLLHVTLITNYPYGSDVNLETYVFALTKNAQRWNPNVATDLLTSTYNAMLSVTIMPSILSNVSGIGGVSIFKIIYPLILSIVPVVLYKIYEQQFGSRVAFLSSFFFASNYIFYTEIVSISKEMIAETLMVLLMFLILYDGMTSKKKTSLFVFLCFGLAVSHYGTSYVFLIFCFAAWLFPKLLKSRSKTLARTCFAILLVFAILWYSFVSYSAPLITIVNLGNNMFAHLLELFNPNTRQQDVLKGLGVGISSSSVGHLVGNAFYYATEFFIVIGLAAILIQRGTKRALKPEYIGMSVVAMIFVLAGIAIPYFASALNISRIFHFSLFLLAPLCVLGGETLIAYLSKLGAWIGRSVKLSKYHFRIPRIRPEIIVLFIIVIYFFYNTGFIYEVTGDIPTSKALSFTKMENASRAEAIIERVDVFGATWLSSNTAETSIVYGDRISIRNVLASYGMKSQEDVRILYDNTSEISGNSYLYLRAFNIWNGLMVEPNYPIGATYWNTSGISFLSHVDKVYSNGGCEIYLNFT